MTQSMDKQFNSAAKLRAAQFTQAVKSLQDKGNLETRLISTDTNLWEGIILHTIKEIRGDMESGRDGQLRMDIADAMSISVYEIAGGVLSEDLCEAIEAEENRLLTLEG